MATDRYGNEIDQALAPSDRYGNPVSFIDDSQGYKQYTSMRKTQAEQMSGKSQDGEARGYSGGTPGQTAQGLSAAVGLGARAAKFGGADFGFGVGSAIGATQAGLKGADVEGVAKTMGIGVAREALGVIGGPVGMMGKAALGVATAEDPAKAALGTLGSIAGSLVGMAVAGPIGSVVGSKLGSYAATHVEDIGSAIGDVTDSREHEAALDALEDAGYSYGEAAEATSGRSGALGTGGTPTESARTELGRASGVSSVGRDAAGHEGGGADSGGPDSDGGGHGARGGGSEGTSEAGGIGGY